MHLIKTSLNLLSITLLLCFGCSCNRNMAGYRTEKYCYREVESFDTLDFTFDDFYFPPSQVYRGMEGGYFTHLAAREKDYLIVSTWGSTALDIYDIDDQCFVNFLQISDHQGTCNTTWSVRFTDTASFYLLLEDGHLCFQQPQRRDTIINLDKTESMTSYNMNVTGNLRHHNPLTLSADGRYVFFPVEYRRKHRKPEQKLMGRLDLLTGQVEFTGIYRPDFLTEKDYGLLRNNIYHHVTDSCIYYSFEPVAEVWKYHFETDSVHRHIVKSKYQTRETKPIPFERSPETIRLLLKHHLHSPYYSDLIYDPYRECFYRFHHHALPRLMDDGFPPANYHKRVSVMVLDRDLNTLGETILPQPCSFVYFAIPTKEGLLINHGPMGRNTSEGIPMLRIGWNVKE